MRRDRIAAAFAVLAGAGALALAVWRAEACFAPRGRDLAVALLIGFSGVAAGGFFHALAHEIGHLLFGWAAGMKFYALTVGPFSLERRAAGKRGVRLRLRRSGGYAGLTAMIPKSGERLAGRYAALTAGGLVFSFLWLTFLALAVAFAPSFGAAYFALGGALCPALYGFILNAVPCSGPRGRTDGAVLAGLVRRDDAALVLVRVLAAQAAFCEGVRPSEADEALFAFPPLPEDDPLFPAALGIRYLRFLDGGERDEARRTAERLSGLETLPEPDASDAKCDLLYELARAGEREQAEAVYPSVEKALRGGSATDERICAEYALVRGEIAAARAAALRAKARADEHPIAGIGRMEKALAEEQLERIEALSLVGTRQSAAENRA